ncbi:MAG: YggS family pyridoxal phosphate-dependent enzyme [Caldisericia bacterium]
MEQSYILKNIESIFKEIPDYVYLIAVTKDRTINEIELCIKGGVKILGINYVQQGEKIYTSLKDKVDLHLIGHLQKNKINKALKFFNMIQTIDSIETIEKINERLKNKDKKIPILVEVNIAKEKNKFGVLPENLFSFFSELSKFDKILVMGLMTMGPNTNDKNIIRKYFKETYNLYNQLRKIKLKNTELKFLSMGMSDSYKIAIEEGSNMIRIGRKIFLEQNY